MNNYDNQSMQLVHLEYFNNVEVPMICNIFNMNAIMAYNIYHHQICHS